MGPQVKVKEFFTSVGVSCFQGGHTVKYSRGILGLGCRQMFRILPLPWQTEPLTQHRYPSNTVVLEQFYQGNFQKLSCYKDGLNMSAVRSMSKGSVNRLKICPCLPNYYGSQCSIPGCVYKVPKNSKIIRHPTRKFVSPKNLTNYDIFRKSSI